MGKSMTLIRSRENGPYCLDIKFTELSLNYEVKFAVFQKPEGASCSDNKRRKSAYKMDKVYRLFSISYLTYVVNL